MTPTEQDNELRDLLEQNGWKFYEELNGFRKESKFTIPMFSTNQSKDYDTLSVGNYYELAQLITADRKRVELETLLDVKSNSEEAYVGEDWWSDDNVMDNSAYEIPRLYLDNRIAELKAQQEEV